MNILHGLTGSIATTILSKFQNPYNDHLVKFVLTDASKKFSPEYYKFNSLRGQKNVPEFLKFNYFDDDHEWDIYDMDQKVLHIELRKWADAFVVAPCSANTLAKIANGISDNLLTCVARAWDFNKQFIVAPSMNVNMWTHPITQEHVKKIEGWGIKVAEPVEKTLFCGDTGVGAMAHIDDIIARIEL